jgi:hypothetical protein
MIKNSILVFGFIVLVAVAGCNSGDRKNGKNSTSRGIGALFFDYKVWGDEESGEVIVNLQFRIRDLDGNAVSLAYPGQVMFDEVLLPVDSSKMNGFYYETRQPVENFEGKHSIVFTDENKKEYKEEFDFAVISLQNELPAVLRRREYTLQVAGLDSLDVIRLLITDTSFYSRGVDRTDTVRNGRITITERDLENLRNGPVFMEIYKESDQPLKETISRGGGRLFLSFGLKRSFELRD